MTPIGGGEDRKLGQRDQFTATAAAAATENPDLLFRARGLPAARYGPHNSNASKEWPPDTI